MKIFNNIFEFDDIFSLKNNFNATKKFVTNKEGEKTSKLRNYNERLLQSCFSNVERINWDDYFYDITVEEDHPYVANGYVVHNSNDDLIIAMCISLFHRNRAVNSGDSFLIAEDGQVLSYESSKNENVVNASFSIVSSEDNSNMEFEDEVAEGYKWLLG